MRATDVIHGGNGIDTVDYTYRQGEIIHGTPGAGPDGTTREHDDIGADVERVLLPGS